MERLSPTQASFRRDQKLVLEAMKDGKLVQKNVPETSWGSTCMSMGGGGGGGGGKDIIILSHSYFSITCMSMGLG